jgi:ABC-type phosphate transport system substrate-binding protein
MPPGKLKPGQFCLWDTTMDLLSYVNDTPYAISYAEADALPFFPEVRAIPIRGYAPTRANALDGDYTFVANEHLLTEDKPTAAEKDFLQFLSSGPEIAQFRGNAFIACPDLSGSAVPNDCSQYPAP